MASGAFFDPNTLLLAGPLVSSTCSLLFAWDQHFFLSVLTSPRDLSASDRAMVNKLLPGYFSRVFSRGVWQVVGFLAATTWLGAGCAWRLGREHAAFGWYAGAATLAVGHLGFVPWVAPKVKAVVDDEGSQERVEAMREWLGVNWVRMWTTDLGAWVCCMVAVTRALASTEQ